MTRSVRVRARVAIMAPLLLVGSTFATFTVGGEAAAQSRPAVGTLPTLSPPDTSRALPRELPAEAQPLVVPEECLTVTGDRVEVLRYAGDNRYETAVCASFWTWDDHDDREAVRRAQAVVLARGDEFADALAGGPLAAYLEGPLLLTRPDELPAFVLEEIQRVLPADGVVYLLGSDTAISEGVERTLEENGIEIRRLAGANRYETAIAVAEELPDTSNFFFATGLSFPDALAAGTAAAALSRDAKLDEDPETRPYALLPTAGEIMPAVVTNFVEARGSQFGEWTLVTAGAPANQAAIEAFGSGSLAARFVGANRYDTAVQIADGVFLDDGGRLVGTGAGLATGTNFPDALAATATLALYAEPLLLTHPTQLTSLTRTFLEDHAGEGRYLDVFGGPPAVSQSVVNAAEVAFTFE